MERKQKVPVKLSPGVYQMTFSGIFFTFYTCYLFWPSLFK